MRTPPTAILVLFAWLAAAPVEARVVRVASFNIEGTNSLTGPGPAGSADYAATKAVLARINADIVAFQELLGPNEANWRSIASELGYPHVLFGTNGTTMSGNQRLGYFSRFPIANSTTVSSPPGANEMTRLPLRIVINVTGAAKPLVLWNMHHKADDGTPTNTPGNQFRRAVEAHRIVQDINAYLAANPSHDEFVMLGDLNDDFSNTGQAAQFTNVPSVTSPSFDLGSDIQFPVLYRVFPDQRYASAGGGLHRLDLRQQNGSSRVTRPASVRTLDYILVSTALRDSPLGAPQGEVYHSQLDAGFAGLPKSGSPLDAATSLAASDHLALFADIHMNDANPAPSIVSFSPTVGAPGTTVVIEGSLLGGVNSVRFGGVEAFPTQVTDSRVTAIVPQGALSGPITVSDGTASASSIGDFSVTALPTIASGVPSPSSLAGFSAVTGAASAAQSFSVSAAGLGGPLQISAPSGFEVSLDGTNFSTSVSVSAPPRWDAALNYTGPWTNGSTGGNGFGAWQIFENTVRGQAQAFLGNPTNSDVQGMASAAFALRASPQGSGANVWALRPLELPLAAGEALSLDWGINWDANGGSKGFLLTSGSATLLTVIQYGYPGPVFLWYGNTFVDTGLVYGTRPMRWTFRQINATTLNVAATSREGGTNTMYSTNVPVPGAVTGLWCFAAEMEPDARRISYYDNLNIAPIAPGGGAIVQTNIFVRLSSIAPAGPLSGALALSAAGQPLASVGVSGTVVGLPPLVSLTLPAATANSTAGSELYLNAVATNADGTPLSGAGSGVTFIINGAPVVGTPDLLKPSVYSFRFTLPSAGRYEIVAQATDSVGSVRDSEAVPLQTSAPRHPLPSVQMLDLLPGAPTMAGGLIVLRAKAIFPSAAAANARVQFFGNGVYLGEAVSVEGDDYTFIWRAPDSPGETIKITACAMADNFVASDGVVFDGSVISGSAAVVNLTTPVVPVVTITGPSGTIPDDVTTSINATASIASGDIARVEFYVDGVLVGIDDTAPYTLPWTPSSPGAYGIAAIATSSAGISTVSPVAQVTVQSSYASWAQSFGLDPQGNGARGADADGDGFSNRLEFAFGENPNAESASMMESSVVSSGNFIVRYLARLDGFTYAIHRSSDLRSGFAEATGVTPAVSASQSDVPTGWQRMEFSVPASGAAFYRVQIIGD